MKKYSIKLSKKDFVFLDNNVNMKGTRPKRVVVDKQNKEAMFKYEHPDYYCSEACSEKLSYEIAKTLGYECAKIEFAYDENGNLGVLNYLFLNKKEIEHMDAVVYLNKNNTSRPIFYTISNIKKCLDELDSNLFNEFLKIMVFDALIGEQDRHEENWGIQKVNGIYKMSPLYDNGCSLLNYFKNENVAMDYYSGKKDFEAYITRSQTIVYKENNKNKYKHFELISYLNNEYHDSIQKELKKLELLTDKKINEIVNKIPDELLTKKHMEYIIMYLKKRRDILLNIR